MRHGKMYIALTVAMILGSLLAACRLPGQPSASASITLDGTSWTLHQIGDQDVISDQAPTLLFSTDQVHGNATCNQFTGSHTVDGSSLSFGPLASTRMACPDMALETAYFAALGEIAAYQVQGEQLVLSNADGKEILVFTPAREVSLGRTPWQLVAYNNGKGGVTSVMRETEITAEFREGQVTGSAGCNSYFASATVDGNQLTVGVVGSTEMACMEPEGVMAQEQLYLHALSSAVRFQIEGDKLTMWDAADARVLTFAIAGQ
jgi:heat shock protein HslJ